MPHPLDRGNLEEIIQRSPEQLMAGLDAAAQTALPRGRFSSVLLTGMGGSALGGELLLAAGLSRVPLRMHRSYGLPREVSADTLVIAISFSGNTEETLDAYQAARTRALSVIGVSAGGTLEQRCGADGAPFIKIPADPPTMQPRYASGYAVGILAHVLARLALAVDGAVEVLRDLPHLLQTRMGETRTQGEALVPALAAATPVIYTSPEHAAVAHIWKIKLNENAKTPAFWNVFPELNHNEMLGWSFPQGPFHLILLRDEETHPRILKRFEVTLPLLTERGVSASIVPITGSSFLEKVFGTLLIGDWMARGLALARGIDPSPVDMVEDLKKRLKESFDA